MSYIYEKIITDANLALQQLSTQLLFFKRMIRQLQPEYSSYAFTKDFMPIKGGIQYSYEVQADIENPEDYVFIIDPHLTIYTFVDFYSAQAPEA